jgi:UDP-glucose-4-epimerase GalE
MKPAILVTGGAGYIGSHTALALAQKGFHPIILDSFVYNQPFNPDWATVIRQDFADRATLEMIFKTYPIQAVMHFAASIEVGKSVTAPLPFYHNNVTKTLTLLELMLEHNVKNFIFSSSCAVYGIPQWLPLKEDHPKNPISPYGKTKFKVEMILEDLAHAHDLRYVGLRYFNAAGLQPGYGLGEYHEPETHVIPLLLRASRLGTPFYIFGTDHTTQDGTCIRDFLHVSDIAKAHALALDYLAASRPSCFYNLGTGQGTSVRQLVEITQKVTGKEVNTVFADRRQGDPAVLVADPSLAFTQLGWSPEYSGLEYILKTTFEH